MKHLKMHKIYSSIIYKNAKLEASRGLHKLSHINIKFMHKMFTKYFWYHRKCLPYNSVK